MADMLGADIPLLTALLSQAAQNAETMVRTLDTLKKSYDEAKRVAGFAEEARQAYLAVSSYNGELFQEGFTRALESAFPDVGYFRREASHAGPWAQASGELQRLVSICLGGPSGSCRQLQEALSLQQTREALARTFGAAPTGAHDLAAIDHEAAVAIAASSAQEGRSQRATALSEALMKQCSNATDQENLAACQAAANAAQIEALRQSADTNSQLAEGNRLQALQLVQVNRARKKELADAEERRELVLESVRRASSPVPRVESDGVSLIPDGAGGSR